MQRTIPSRLYIPQDECINKDKELGFDHNNTNIHATPDNRTPVQCSALHPATN